MDTATIAAVAYREGLRADRRGRLRVELVGPKAHLFTRDLGGEVWRNDLKEMLVGQLALRLAELPGVREVRVGAFAAAGSTSGGVWCEVQATRDRNGIVSSQVLRDAEEN